MIPEADTCETGWWRQREPTAPHESVSTTAFDSQSKFKCRREVLIKHGSICENNIIHFNVAAADGLNEFPSAAASCRTSVK